MKRKHTPGCYCCLEECSCQQLSDYLATQPGTITGYTPVSNWWQQNACCWRRTYRKTTLNPTYICEDVCVPDLFETLMGGPPDFEPYIWQFNDCIRFGSQFEIERGYLIDVYIFQYNFGSNSPPWNFEPWNTACGPFSGCKIIVLSRYLDNIAQNAVVKGPYAHLCVINAVPLGYYCGDVEGIIIDPPCPETPDDTYPCPAADTCGGVTPEGLVVPPTSPCTVDGCNCIRVSECNAADVDWWRIKIFDAVPSGQSVSFGNGDVTSCYCTDGLCNFPCSFATSAVDFITTNQCVELQRKVFGCITPLQYPGCEDYTDFEHCFTPPTWTVNL